MKLLEVAMDLNEYQNLARQTAIYPGMDGVRKGDLQGLTYVILGLVGEIGEAEGRNWQDSEVGDCCWYFSQVCWELEIPLGNLPRQTKGRRFSTVFQAIADVANTFKKSYRDDGAILTSQKKEMIKKSLAEAWNILERSMGPEYIYGVILPDNVVKLQGRANRGTLQGSGEGR